MLRYERHHRLFAAALAALAGYADANAFVHLGGYFVSFMSGNSTRLGVGLASNLHAAALAGGMIALFVTGVVISALCNKRGDKHGGLRVLYVVTALLMLAAVLATLNATAFSIAALALAMGAVNVVFQRDGEVSIGVTYMTGTLVRMGQKIAAAFTGGARWDWFAYLMLWLGLVTGAMLGAFAYNAFGLMALWAAALTSAALTVVFSRFPD